ncbi:unnamed protein product [Trypanosoma congolense IL3000]|uniref:WGS project CAEQ00000000 data, annotated contig 1025 n=1 Tax=Trypanosoma congolense (strain IL3000) TaxID=1068625 RepID=F9W3A2_TRYCI|nr:unnamed protein product [Trypanosoma congolense IL3000]
MGNVLASFPIGLGGRGVKEISQDHKCRGPDDLEQLTELLTALRSREGHDICSVEIRPVETPLGLSRDVEAPSAYSVTLRGVTLEDGDVELIRECKSVTQLSFVDCVGRLDLKDLAGHSFLAELHIDVSGKVDRFDALQDLPSLRNLWIRNEKMTGRDFWHISTVHTLESLGVRGAINSMCLGILMHLPHLKILDLSETMINDKCLRVISISRTLIRLDVSSCKRLEDVSSLSSITTLEELNLSQCNVLVGVDLLGKLPFLQVLDLRGTSFPPGTIFGLSESKSLSGLYISSCPDLTEVVSIRQLGTLDQINISRRSDLRKSIEVVGCLQLLRTLEMSNTSITDDCLDDLMQCRFLSKLDLSLCCNLRDVGALSEIKNLEELNLGGCSNITKGVDQFGRLAVLRVLNLSGNWLYPGLLLGISSARTLAVLDLSSCHIEPPTTGRGRRRSAAGEGAPKSFDDYKEEVQALGRLPVLQLLDMSDTCITDSCITGLSKSRSLKTLNLSSCKQLTNVRPLASIRSLEVLNLAWCKNLEYGTEALGKIPRLRVLDLSNAAINDHCFHGIANSHRLSSWVPGLSRVPLVNLLRRITVTESSLSQLDLSLCWGLIDIAYLADIATLRELRLRGCRNLRSGFHALGRLPLLQMLDLSDTLITDGCLKGLQASRSLLTLNLSSCNRLTDISPIANILSLEVLNLRQSENVKKGIDALAGHPRLCVLYMSSTNISYDLAQTLRWQGILLK